MSCAIDAGRACRSLTISRLRAQRNILVGQHHVFAAVADHLHDALLQRLDLFAQHLHLALLQPRPRGGCAGW
jgi:hypothetical protein